MQVQRRANIVGYDASMDLELNAMMEQLELDEDALLAIEAREAITKRCYNCGEEGHLCANCPHPPRPSRFKAFRGRGRGRGAGVRGRGHRPGPNRGPRQTRVIAAIENMSEEELGQLEALEGAEADETDDARFQEVVEGPEDF